MNAVQAATTHGRFNMLYISAYKRYISCFSGCNLDIQNNTHGTHAPILLVQKNNDLNEIITYRGRVKLRKGESFILACPGAKNTLDTGSTLLFIL